MWVTGFSPPLYLEYDVDSRSYYYVYDTFTCLSSSQRFFASLSTVFGLPPGLMRSNTVGMASFFRVRRWLGSNSKQFNGKVIRT